MKNKKRKRSTIRNAQKAILKVGNQLQDAGIDVTKRVIIVGGAPSKPVWKARRESGVKKLNDEN